MKNYLCFLTNGKLTRKKIFFCLMAGLTLMATPKVCLAQGMPALSFLNGNDQYIQLSENSGTKDISAMLAVRDVNFDELLEWSTSTPPTNGTLVADFAALSTGAIVEPVGLSYTPAAGFTGMDSFTVIVSNGIITCTTTFFITIPPDPTVSLAGSCAGNAMTINSNLAPYQLLLQRNGITYFGAGPSWNDSAVTVAANGISGDQLKGIARDKNGNIYAALNSGSIVKYASGSTAATSPMIVAENGLSTNVVAVKLDTAGNIYVADAGLNAIVKFPPASTYSTSGTVVAQAGISSLTNTFVDASGNIYAVSYLGSSITKFPPTSTYSTTGTVVAQMDVANPLCMFIDANGYLYVGNTFAVERFPANSGSSTIGTVVASNAGTGIVADLSVDGYGNVYVLDKVNNILSEFQYGWNGSTTPIVIAGGPTLYGSGPRQLEVPIGLITDENGNMYVADANNNRIQKFANNLSLTSIAATPGVYEATVKTFAGGSSTTNEITVAVCNTPPTFTNGNNPGFSICQDSPPFDISSLLSVSDTDAGQTETWAVVSPPSGGGTLDGFSTTGSSGSGTITPTGLLYTPPAAYTGTDVFVIRVSDGIAIATTTVNVTVSAAPVISAGSGIAICNGSPTPLTATGGAIYMWSPATGLSATTGASVTATPASTTTYTITGSNGGSCSNTATVTVSVNMIPTINVTTGLAICSGSSAPLTATGGNAYSWSPATGLSATTGASVTADPASTIVYTVTATTGGCSDKATVAVTVNTTSAGTITGPASVAAGSNITLTDAVVGGSWSASNSNATVAGGVVSGVATGTVTISYTVSGTCGAVSATKLVSVGTGSVAVSAISGYSSYLCTGTTSGFWDATTGGTWSMSPASVATVSATGVVYGMGAGTATLFYTYLGTTVTSVVTVYPSPAAIMGSGIVCVGATTALSDATAGGIWSSSSGSVASISTAGVVTGTVASSATINYTIPSTGCKAVMTVTVTTGPSGIGGASSVCVGSAISVSDFVAGGAWSCTAPASIAPTGSASALVTGLSAGPAVVTYSSGSNCYRTFNITVKDLPTPILGNLSVCGIGAKTFLSDMTTSVSWTSSSTSIAIVSTSGVVLGEAPGTVAITFTAANTCKTTAIVTVNALVTLPAILGATNVGHGVTITLSDLAGGGLWSSSNAGLGSVDASGDVTGVGTSGTVTISYAVPYGSGCTATATKSITVHTPAPENHEGSITTVVGARIDLGDDAPGGEWTSSDNSIAAVDVSGTVTALAAGDVKVSHTTVDGNGYVSTSATQLTVNPLPFEIKLLPNPNRGAFTIVGTIGSNRDEAVTLEIADMLGQVIYTGKCIAEGGTIKEQVVLRNGLPNGTYLLNIHATVGSKVVHFVVER